MKNLKNKNDKEIVRLLWLVSIILILLYIIAKPTITKIKNEHTYNHGVCTECGGYYEFISAAKNTNIAYYYYKCNKCGKLIEISK